MTLRDPIPPLGRHSPRLRAFRELVTAGARRREGAFVIEGPHLFEQLVAELEAGRSVPFRPRFIVVSESYLDRFRSLRLDEACRRHGLSGGTISDRVMGQLSDCETPPGILAELTLPEERRDLGDRAIAMAGRRTLRIVLAEGVSDPGNLGTLARSAAGLGADLFLAHGGADPFGPKVLRATAGAFLILPYGQTANPERLLKELARREVRVIATVARGGHDLPDLRSPARWVLLLGSEAHGLPGAWVRHASLTVTIPLQRGVESLNVATAGSIILHHLCATARGHRPRR